MGGFILFIANECSHTLILTINRLKKLFEEIPRYNCSERCKAPNEFYSGAPFLTIPENGDLKIRAGESKFVEWQIWTTNEELMGLRGQWICFSFQALL